MGVLKNVSPVRSQVSGSSELAAEPQQTGEGSASTTSQSPQDTYSAGKKAPVDLAAEPSVLADRAANVTAQVSHAWYADLHRATDDFGVALQGAGTQLEEGGEALRPVVEFAGEATERGQAAIAAGEDLLARPDQSLELAAALAPTAREYEAWGGDFDARVRRQVGAGLAASQAALTTVAEGVGNVVGAVRDWGVSLAQATEPNQNIALLGPHDTYTLAVGGSGSIEGAEAYASGSIEVSRTEEGKYVVAVDGQLGGGLYAAIGGRLGAELNAEASAGLGGGGTVEMTFDTMEGAQQAVRLVRSRLHPSLADPNDRCLDCVGVLTDHTSAIELRGNHAALGNLAAQLGAKSVVGLSASGGLMGELAIRVELRDDLNRPKPPELVVTQTLAGQASLVAGIRTVGQQALALNAQARPIGATGQATIEFEQRWLVPKTSVGALLRDPVRTLRESKNAVVKLPNETVTLGLEVSGQGFGNGSGVNVEATYVGDFERLPRVAMEALLRGDVGAMLQALDETEVSVKVEPYTTIGVSLSPGVSLMGFGVGAQFEATRKDVAEPQYRYQSTGKPSVLAPEVTARLAPYLPS